MAGLQKERGQAWDRFKAEVAGIVAQVRERGQRHGNPFLEVLARPGALRFSAAGVVGRMPMSMFGLGTILLIASVTGRYGLAGIVAAAGSGTDRGPGAPRCTSGSRSRYAWC